MRTSTSYNRVFVKCYYRVETKFQAHSCVFIDINKIFDYLLKYNYSKAN